MRRELDAGYELDDDPARVDRAEVHRFISVESYWAAGRSRAAMDGLIDRAARTVGLYRDGAQVGFSRTVDVPDAGLVYLADVYVHADHRGGGRGVEPSGSRSWKDRSPSGAGSCTRPTRMGSTSGSGSTGASGCSSGRPATD